MFYKFLSRRLNRAAYSTAANPAVHAGQQLQVSPGTLACPGCNYPRSQHEPYYYRRCRPRRLRGGVAGGGARDKRNALRDEAGIVFSCT